jgi:hypothetical protein
MRWQAEGMDAYSSPSNPSRRASRVVRIARRLSYVAGEISYAQKRLFAVRLGYGVAESDRAPDTYTDFLLRSAAAVTHEPPARSRACGRQVR